MTCPRNILIGLLCLTNPGLTALANGLPGMLVFSAVSNGNWDLYAWYGDGRDELVRLTETPYDEKSPALSSDGRRLAYATSGGELMLRDLGRKGEGEMLLIEGYPGYWDYPSFSPDGNRLVATYFDQGGKDSARLFVVDLETRQPAPVLEQYGPQQSPDWAPQGNRVVYGYGHCSHTCGGIVQEPWVVNLGSGKARQLLMSGAYNTAFTWGRRGERMLFTSDRDGNYDIWLMDLGTARLERMTDYQGLDDSPAISPDGKWMAFVSNRTGKREVWLMDLSTRAIEPFPPLRGSEFDGYKDLEWK